MEQEIYQFIKKLFNYRLLFYIDQNYTDGENFITIKLNEFYLLNKVKINDNNIDKILLNNSNIDSKKQFYEFEKFVDNFNFTIISLEKNERNKFCRLVKNLSKFGLSNLEQNKGSAKVVVFTHKELSKFKELKNDYEKCQLFDILERIIDSKILIQEYMLKRINEYNYDNGLPLLMFSESDVLYIDNDENEIVDQTQKNVTIKYMIIEILLKFKLFPNYDINRHPEKDFLKFISFLISENTESVISARKRVGKYLFEVLTPKAAEGILPYFDVIKKKLSLLKNKNINEFVENRINQLIEYKNS